MITDSANCIEKIQGDWTDANLQFLEDMQPANFDVHGAELKIFSEASPFSTLFMFRIERHNNLLLPLVRWWLLSFTSTVLLRESEVTYYHKDRQRLAVLRPGWPADFSVVLFVDGEMESVKLFDNWLGGMFASRQQGEHDW